jgi:hypothetical protein
MMDDLSPSEQQIARDLSALAADPSPVSRSSIMQGVRAARRPAPSGMRWRVLIAVAAAVLLLASGTVGAMAASSQALPDSAAYPLRFAGEGIRLAIASPVDREHLRIDFARDRFRQAIEVVRDNRADAKQLIADGREYLDQTRRDLPSLSADQQGQVETEINQAGEDQKSAESELDQQQGDQGQN